MAIDQITTGIIKDNAVTSAKIPAGAVEIADVADDAITSAKIAAGAVDATALGTGAVTTAKLAADAIDGTKIADNAVNSEHYTDGSIDTAHIGDDQVTGAKIENNPTIAGNLAVTGKTTLTGDLVPSSPLSHRNMIINGEFQIFQRATGATNAGATYQTADRWSTNNGTDGVYTTEKQSLSLAEQNTTGHSSCWLIKCTTADTNIVAGQYANIFQWIEALNCQHLQYGTANAKTLTLSFWVKSNKTGTYTVSVQKEDATAYFLAHEYSISSANTWEKKTITITPTAGSTSLITGSGGIINNDNGRGIQIGFGLAWGSSYHTTNNTWTTSSVYSTSNQVNWMDSTSNNFYLTGVQLELGSNATPFEHRSYADELHKCHRYFVKFGNGTNGACCNLHTGAANAADKSYFNYWLPVVPRATPTLSITGQVRISDNYLADHAASPPGVQDAPVDSSIGGRIRLNGFSSLTIGRTYGSAATSGTGFMNWNMEL